MKIIKQELQFEETLKQKLEFICEFAKVTPTFINGNIKKTNLTYIEKTHIYLAKYRCELFIYVVAYQSSSYKELLSMQRLMLKITLRIL